MWLSFPERDTRVFFYWTGPIKKFEVRDQQNRDAVYTSYYSILPINPYLINNMSNSATCPVSNSASPAAASPAVPLSEEEQMSKMLDGFTRPLKMVLVVDDTTHEATFDMGCTVYDHTLQKSWPNALAYVRHYHGDVTARDALRLLAVSEGSMADTTLWQIINRLPGFLEEAGLTEEQIDFRKRVASLPYLLPFRVIDGKGKEHTVTLCENRLFSSEWDDGMSAQEVCRIFKDWKDPSLQDAMSVLYYTDADGKEWRLSEIVALSPFRQECFPDKPSESELRAEVTRRIDLIERYYRESERAQVIQELMTFLYEDCEDILTLYPGFRLATLGKCEDFMTKYSQFPDLVAACQRLMDVWERFR